MKTFYYSRFFALLLAVNFLLSSCKDTTEEITAPTVVSKPTSTYDQSVATRWTDLQIKLIKTTPNYVPPIAARTLGYTSLGLYESVVGGMNGYQSLVGQINGLTSLPKPDATKEYNWALAANASQYTLIKEFYSNTTDANKKTIDSLYSVIETALKTTTNNVDISARSIDFGKKIATAIYEHSKTDGGHEGWKNIFPTTYAVPQGIGFWKATGAQKIPLLPYWGNVRSLVALNVTTNPNSPTLFSYKTDSKMFALAKEVYDASKKLTQDQKNIALFWADGGKTLTPPGHHFNIANIVLKKEKATLDKVAETYAKVGIAVNDAFIACWRCKYKFNLMRPVTYINEAIDPSWKPLIDTPPFPEYTSGHSSGSGAAAEILTNLFGKNYSFTDNTWEGTFPNRSFTSFYEYANEAALSRLYGGIHYSAGNAEGLENGKRIGQNVLNLKFKK